MTAGRFTRIYIIKKLTILSKAYYNGTYQSWRGTMDQEEGLITIMSACQVMGKKQEWLKIKSREKINKNEGKRKAVTNNRWSVPPNIAYFKLHLNNITKYWSFLITLYAGSDSIATVLSAFISSILERNQITLIFPCQITSYNLKLKMSIKK